MNRNILSLLQQLLDLLKEVCDQPEPGNTPPPSGNWVPCSPRPYSGQLPRLYDRREVMEYLRFSDRTFSRYKKKGILQVTQVGKRDFVTADALQAALEVCIRRGRI